MMKNRFFALAYGLAACGFIFTAVGLKPALIGYVLLAAIFSALAGMSCERSSQ